MKYKEEIGKHVSNLQRIEKVIEIILQVVEVEFVVMKLLRIGRIAKKMVKQKHKVRNEDLRLLYKKMSIQKYKL